MISAIPTRNYKVILPSSQKNPPQQEFIDSEAQREIARAGRRGGKTTGVSVKAAKAFLKGKRVLYAAPTVDQVGAFWFRINSYFGDLVDAGIYYRNQSERIIEVPGTANRIRAKTAWNADTLRGDYADVLILDEWQLMNEDAWELVGAPMLLDNNGRAVFIYTPPSLQSRSVTKAKDPRHAAKMFEKAQKNTNGRWKTFHWTSRDNGYISAAAIDEIAEDMTPTAYRMEIEAEDLDEAPGALWKRAKIDSHRVIEAPDLQVVCVGVDPSITSAGDEAGVVTAGARGGKAQEHLYVLSDDSKQGSPVEWATEAVHAYKRHKANCIVAEANQGGEMVRTTIHTVDGNVPVKLVHATRGKWTRAEPISAVYEAGRGHHVGSFPKLENEMVLWTPGTASPNRMDALVWAGYYLLKKSGGGFFI